MESPIIFKFITCGDVSVGKSCLVQQYLENTFRQFHDVTLGVEFGMKTIVMDKRPIKLHIWDTAGLEVFRSVTRQYYRNAQGALLVYDVTRRETFEHLDEWVKDIREYADPEIVIMLVANKCDLSKREVRKDEGESFAQAHGLHFHETSAKTGANVEKSFLSLMKAISVKNDAMRNTTEMSIATVPIVTQSNRSLPVIKPTKAEILNTVDTDDKSCCS
ncbi:Rab2c [Monocercomonoides exilis]|uniref:Rab2c n=1 Tax=Monocercomonoides exilis TaxID=2049356 RepID=UPI00355ABFA7|nr:Rab2c [Monocercomonoides exilis]|eukprot:MONOS_16763.1-p1 / transcript=MONOS_16763.1 / gene=MONOS_16763 / organism=Monocercomonoides_exilis_PA203 / gene_product=Rab2c / transcript_product=Rab2c / location=Mono_scaffold00001:164781-165631(-) / protein_length=218 / sequence_SO=supercontig / SO=protein_coding / is_pseudo=false